MYPWFTAPSFCTAFQWRLKWRIPRHVWTLMQIFIASIMACENNDKTMIKNLYFFLMEQRDFKYTLNVLQGLNNSCAKCAAVHQTCFSLSTWHTKPKLHRSAPVQYFNEDSCMNSKRMISSSGADSGKSCECKVASVCWPLTFPISQGKKTRRRSRVLKWPSGTKVCRSHVTLLLNYFLTSTAYAPIRESRGK